MPSVKFRRVLSMRECKFRKKNFAMRRDLSDDSALFGCHVERSETSLAIVYCTRRSGDQRFFASLRMTRKACATSNHSKLHPPSLADHVLVPWRIPNELDISFVDAVDTENF